MLAYSETLKTFYSHINQNVIEQMIVQKLGFKVDINREVSDKKAGTVLEQSLEKGYKQDPTDKDRTITLIQEDGQEIVCDILFTYYAEEFNKNYVVFQVR